MYNLYEAARKSSVTPRIIFASSNHAIGFHKQSERLDANSLTRPDGLYGVSKVFGEALGLNVSRQVRDRDRVDPNWDPAFPNPAITACCRLG